MKEKLRDPITYADGRRLLFDNATSAVPFNVLMALILLFILPNSNVPVLIVVGWFVVMLIVSALRILHCIYVLKNKIYLELHLAHLKLFQFLSFATGIVWTAIYFLSVPFTSALEPYIILLIFGGMSAGASASLAPYLPAYFAYILSVFLPIILYNAMKWGYDSEIIALVCLMFLAGIILVARNNNKLLKKLFALGEENKMLVEKLSNLSETDALTGLYNRRKYDETFNSEQKRARRNQHNYALVYLDVDNFKALNDTFGHAFGDEFLKYFSSYLKYYFKRENDMIFRIGGDEFAILLINVNKEQVKLMCHKIKEYFKSHPAFDYERDLPGRQELLDNVTLSMGVAFIEHDRDISVEEIISLADGALYEAKDAGKNKIVCA